MKKLLSTGLLSAALFTGCGSAISDFEKDGCEHLKDGPAKAVTATSAVTGAPDVSDEHTRFDIALVDVSGGKGGTVIYRAGAQKDFGFILNQDVTLKVKDSAGAEVAFEETAKNSSACTELKAKYVAGLKAGSHTLEFGPTTQASVSLVVVEGGEHAH
jgi:hypothetical protein